jgi:hypothetical protein
MRSRSSLLATAHNDEHAHVVTCQFSRLDSHICFESYYDEKYYVRIRSMRSTCSNVNCGGLNTAVMEARVRTSPLLLLKNVFTLHYIRVWANVDVSEKVSR